MADFWCDGWNWVETECGLQLKLYVQHTKPWFKTILLKCIERPKLAKDEREQGMSNRKYGNTKERLRRTNSHASDRDIIRK